MKLIPKSQFDNLRVNDAHEYDINECGGKRVVKIYARGRLIAKSVKSKSTHSTKLQYFAVKGYDVHLQAETDTL
jgi:hypothetical protein